MTMGERFFSMHSHGFIRAAVCVPAVRVAQPFFNAEATLRLARRASEARARQGVGRFCFLGTGRWRAGLQWRTRTR